MTFTKRQIQWVATEATKELAGRGVVTVEVVNEVLAGKLDNHPIAVSVKSLVSKLKRK